MVVSSFQLTAGDRRARLAAFASIVLLGCLVYSNSFHAPLVFDGVTGITENASIRQLWPPGASLQGTRPIVNFTFALNYAWGGQEVAGYHALSLLIHLLAALTLWGLVRCTLQSPRLTGQYGAASEGLALAAALLWLVHPLQTQSVTYVVQRFESLMGLFYLLTLYTFLRAATAPRGAAAWYVLSALCCALGMGSKEVMATAPFMVLAYDRIFIADGWRQIARRRSVYYVALFATLIPLAYLLFGDTEHFEQSGVGLAQSASAQGGSRASDEIAPAPQTGEGGQLTPLRYALTQPGVILHYLRLCVWPTGQSLDYAWPIATSANEILPGVILVGGLLLATIYALFRAPPLGFLGLWFFGVLAPSSSVVPIADLAFEHRMYLSLAAVAVAVVLALYGLIRRLAGQRSPEQLMGYLIPPVAILVLVLGNLTLRRNRDYDSHVSIWADTVQKCPDNARAHVNLGNWLASEGDFPTAKSHLETALRLAPGYAPAYSGYANWLALQGAAAEAEKYYRQAIALNPRDAKARLGLANALAEQGQFDGSRQAYQAVLAIHADAPAHYNFANLLAEHGDQEEALREYRVALSLDPQYVKAHNNLASLLNALGQTDAAVKHWREALRLEPQYVMAHVNLGNALANRGEFSAAQAEFAEALQIDPHSAGALLGAANVLVAQHRPQEALQQYREVLRHAPDHFIALLRAGKLLAGQGEHAEALVYLKAAARAQPDSADARHELGQSYRATGQSDLAEKEFAAAARLRTEHRAGKNALEQTRGAATDSTIEQHAHEK